MRLVGLPCDGCAVMCPDCLESGTGSVASCNGCLAKIAEPMPDAPGAWRVDPRYWGWGTALYVTEEASGPEVSCALCGEVTYLGVLDRDWFKAETLGAELEREVRP